MAVSVNIVNMKGEEVDRHAWLTVSLHAKEATVMVMI